MILFFIFAVAANLLAFPNPLCFYGFWPAAWLCAAPLFFCLARAPGPLRRSLTGGLFGLCFYAMLVSWFIPYSLPGYLLFVLVLSLQPFLFAVFFRPPFKQRMFRLVYWPALWTASEYVRQIFMRGFSWNLGCSQTFNPYILQWASLGGSSLLSFFLVLCNTALYWAVKEKEQRLFYIRALVIANLLAWAGGAALYHFYAQAPEPSFSLRAAVVQADVDPREKLVPLRVTRMVGEHVRLSASVSPSASVDFIVWPETAVPFDLKRDPFLWAKVVRLCRDQRAGVLTGMAWEDREGRLFNGAAWIAPSGTILDVYRKKYLVPFSEETPFVGLPGKFTRNNRGGGSPLFSRGDGLGVFPLRYLRPGLSGSLGVAICSEDAVSALFRKYVYAGAGFIVVLLNDGWFNDPVALIQHAQNSIMRAVETRRPVLRAANTGWTCLVDPRGNVHTPSGMRVMASGTGVLNLAPVYGHSLYVFIGDSFCILLTGFVIISLFLSCIRVKRKNHAMKNLLFLIGVAAGVCWLPALSEAGGVAARQQPGVRVHPQIQVNPSAPGRPGVWPSERPENPAEDAAVKQPTPAPTAVPRRDYPESRVLTSSPEHTGTGRLVPGKGPSGADMTVEESLVQLFAMLEQSSDIWMKISDINYKVLVVSQYIERYQQEGVLIRKPPLYYAQFITAMGEGNPALLSRPFSELLRLAAVMEYDFETGENKDTLARSILGDDMYLANRKRLGMP